MRKTLYSQIYISLVLLIAIAAAFDAGPAEGVLIIGLALSVAVLGLPHGALDFSIAKSLRLVNSFASACAFIFVYLLIAGVSIKFWLAFPAAALSLFLCVSVYHFASDWRAEMPLYAALSLACIILSGPAILYASTLNQLFQALLVSEENVSAIVFVMQTIFGVSSIMFIVFLSRMTGVDIKARAWSLSEYITLFVSSLVLTPLLHFGLYFCVLHSPKHMVDVGEELKFKLKQSILASLPFVILTLFISAGLFFYFSSSDISTALLRYTFIGLFGLTMSHMFLISLWHRSINVARR